MERFLAVATVMVFLVLSMLTVAPSSGQTASKAPPIAQPLVREGDFAVRLTEALKVGKPGSEAEAESMLVGAGIAPRNGWISDYPVTPDIVAELQAAVTAAADSKRLPLRRDEALTALDAVETAFGLAVVPDTSDDYAENQPPQTPQYTASAEVNNYYYDEGPPVVTYYPPPPDYYYLYSWVPSPFWCSGFFFPGFFILADFHKVIIVRHHKFVVTNHVFDHKHGKFFTVDAAKRFHGGNGRIFRGDRGGSQGRAFTSSEGKSGAESIVDRSRERVRSNQGASGMKSDRGGSGSSFSGSRGSERSFSSPQRGGEARSSGAPSTGSRGFSGGGGRGGGFAHGGGGGGCRGRC